MAEPLFHVTDYSSGYKVVEIEIPKSITTRMEFAQALHSIEKDLPGNRPVLFTGRAPVWGYAMLVHSAHPSPAVGVYEPREQGFVIVASHNPSYAAGQLIADSDVYREE